MSMANKLADPIPKRLEEAMLSEVSYRSDSLDHRQKLLDPIDEND
jgi:hypothetical protein